MRINARQLVAAVLSGLLLSGGLPVRPAAAATPRGWVDEIRPQARGGRLAPSLRDDLQSGRRVGGAAVAGPTPSASAERSVRVVVEGTNGSVAAEAVRKAGGAVISAGAASAKGDVPAVALSGLTASVGVRHVREPLMAQSDALSEGVGQIGAGAWQGAGWSGAGVKVAVVDVGFAGYTGLLGTELPATVQTDLTRCSSPLGSPHGTAAAEVVHDVAPGASLRLVCVEDSTDFVSALATLAASGVKVVSSSIGNPLWGRGDASAPPDSPAAAVAALRRQGVLFVSSAGNFGERHFHTRALGDDQSGSFDDLVDLSPDDVFSITVAGSGRGSIAVKWDAWPQTTLDFDVYVGNDTCGIVGASEADQSGMPGGLQPVEYIEFASCSPSSQTFGVVINRVAGVGTPRIDVFAGGDVTGLEQMTGGSISVPAASSAALAVGATCRNGGVQPFSSRGPTIDERTKPDLVGPAAVSTATFGAAAGGCDTGFKGTSAAAAHVAGAGALAIQVNRGLEVAELQHLLERWASDVDPPGWDVASGAGRVALGPPSSTRAPTPQPFTPTTPVRLLDTRPAALGLTEAQLGTGGRDAPLGTGEELAFQVAGLGAVPADATAAVLNVTVTGSTASSYLTIHPGGVRPNTSNLNFGPGQIVAAHVTATIGADDKIRIFNSNGSTHVIIDLAGWYGPTGAAAQATDRFTARASPVRAFDSRADAGYAELGPGRTEPLAEGEDLNVRIAGLGGVPADATGAVLNLTVTGPSKHGYLSLYPAGVDRPVVSSINFAPGQTVANLVVIPLGTGGGIRMFNASGSSHVIVDVIGWYRAGSGAGYVALDPPRRDLDTRFGNGAPVAPLAGSAVHELEAAHFNGVPADAAGVMLNVTAVTPSSGGYLTVFPTGPQPFTSNVNFPAGAVVANAVVAGLGSGGRVSFVSSSSTHVVSDLAGYFVDPANTSEPSDTPVPPDGNGPAGSVTAYQQNELHDGLAQGTLAAPLKAAWSHNMGESASYPLYVDGRVFVLGFAPPGGSYGTRLYAIDAATGDRLWGPVALGGTYSFGGITADATRVYAVNYDGVLRAFDQLSGGLLWSAKLSQYSFTSPPTVRDGTVYLSGDGSGSTFYAVDASNGAVKWTSSVGWAMHVSPAVTTDGVYHAGCPSRAFQLDGTVKWTSLPTCSSGPGKTGVVHDGRMWVRTTGGGSIVSLAEGQEVGTFDSFYAPALVGNRAFYVSGGNLRGVDLTTGQVLWTQTSDYTVAPIAIDGKVAIGTASGRVILYDQASGAEVWSAQAGAPVTYAEEWNASSTGGLAVAGSMLLVPTTSGVVAYVHDPAG